MSEDKKPLEHPCPMCEKPHSISKGNYIKCNCGLVLKKVVPIVKITLSGIMWFPIGYHEDGDEEVVSKMHERGTEYMEKENA